MSVRVRFAPSPTGQVHIGNIRTAIFNWLFARHEDGDFLIRIEDTDLERSTPEAIGTVFDALEWLGLDHDDDPFYQSRRKSIHMEAAELLLSEGLAYREHRGGKNPGEVVVFRMPDEPVSFEDEIKGTLQKAPEDMKDFVIVRSDGSPVFHLANVVDDIAMRITHVIRGDDHIENTYRHVALYRALGARVPKFAHLPMIVNQQGKPYSKRDGAAFVGEFRSRGYLPETLFNYLALLGWSPGDDREKMTREEMVQAFTLDRVKSGAAQMDLKKLTHLNWQYLSELTLDDFVAYARRAASQQPWWDQAQEGRFREVCELMQSRTNTYDDVAMWKYFFSEDIEYDQKAVRKKLRKEGVKEALAMLRDKLKNAGFDAPGIENAIHEVEDANGIRQGKLNLPIRIAVTGISRGAGIYETMALLGRERVLRRLEYAEKELLSDRTDDNGGREQ
jgi:glutamyl-tRNA synthetase